MIFEVIVTDSTCLILIASLLHERTPALERAIALVNAGRNTLAVIVHDHLKSKKIDGFTQDTAVGARPLSRHTDALQGWIESLAAEERSLGLDVSVLRIEGDGACTATGSYINTIRPAMVIKDIHHEPSIRRYFLSPLDWYLLRRCLCPIQFVAGRSHRLPQKILVAVNLFRIDDNNLHFNDQLLRNASRMAELCLAGLHVVYVYDWSSIYASAKPVFGPLPIESEFQQALSDGLEASLVQLCERRGIQQDNRHFLAGSVTSTLQAFAERGNFDLLVMGILPPRNVRKVIGGTAEAILVHAPCSVLVVKPSVKAP
ncbi:hypothetical protein N018_14300 [Pseudomonas syringae CC1557]|uniref:UspA domain-containing protein n=1 Tax=Pseudomonas syringae CC1557 TaxID=1357279 RepID=W0MYH2_PSESX|nr:universal stress protein [Pseudomonas syringae]AHG43634.1 hypothetical protein N018_14300 [Pseudomonas syringae CC1557]